MKPASSVHPGDLLEIPFPEGPGVRTVFVKSVIDKRVGAPQAQACYEERTPEQVFENLKQWQTAKSEAPKGRPTKKDRRDIDHIHRFWDRPPEVY